ncbi:MAG: divergent polysaccharide deacetylase family protein [Campylobacterota bacterium]|nr:divergent polysaccharide deacetylase family protein [Campylobacterota bacterium]
MNKKNTKKTSQKKQNKTKLKIFSLSYILVFITSLALGSSIYFYLQNSNLKEQNENVKKQLLLTQKEKKEYQDKRAKYFEEKTKALDIEYTNNIENSLYTDEIKKKDDYKFVYDDLEDKKTELTQEIKKDKIVKTDIVTKKEIIKKNIKKIEPISSKPKLAVIIDDVTTQYQVNKILNIGYDVNMAFLPPTSRHRNSAKITNNLDHYMIHLPLQASSNKYDEKNTLYVNDPIEVIEKRIKVLNELYPKAKFINNHTGSKFTSNEAAMDRLFTVLKKYNYIFIDSKTTSKSMALKCAKKHGLRILSRNIFLDNKKDKAYIQNQLKKAINIAKKHGSAIAIGHPYNITFEALKDSKHLLKDLELVYVNKL